MTTISVRRVLAAANLLLSTSLTTLAIPMTYKIEKYKSQCLYDILEDKDHVTVSVTILSGSSLRGTCTVKGPIAANDRALSGSDLFKLGDGFHGHHSTHLYEVFPLNFEDMHAGHDDDDYEDDDELLNDDDIDWDDDDMDDATFRDYYYDADDDDDIEYMFIEDDMMSPEEIKEIREKKAAHEKMTPEEMDIAKAEKKQKNMEDAKRQLDKRKAKKAKRDEKREQMKHGKTERRERNEYEKHMDMMQSGGAIENTLQAMSGGWYMVCVEANANAITAEIEMRSTSDVGPINRKTGHLQTYERHDMLLREKKLFGNDRMESEQRALEDLEKARAAGDSNLPIPDAIKEHDLKNSRHQMMTINRLLNDIKEKQQNERHRILQHTTLNQHSHGRMVLSSLFETVFYIAVSGFQVYTIRKWFRGNPILGY